MIDFVQKQFPNAKVYEGQHDDIIIDYYWAHFEIRQQKTTYRWHTYSIESNNGPINDSFLGAFSSIQEACEKLAISIEERLGPILEDMKNFKIKKEEL